MGVVRVKTTCETEQRIVHRTAVCPFCPEPNCVELGKHIDTPEGYLIDTVCPHFEDYNPATDEWTFETEGAPDEPR